MIRIPAISLLALLASAGLASAATTVHGVVKSFDKLTHTITLENGHSYRLAKNVSLSDIAASSKVALTVEHGRVTYVKFEGIGG